MTLFQYRHIEKERERASEILHLLKFTFSQFGACSPQVLEGHAELRSEVFCAFQKCVIEIIYLF